MNTVVNSAAENTIFRTNGNAVSSTTQPNNKKTRAAGPGTFTSTKANIDTVTGDDSIESFSINSATFPVDAITSDDIIRSIDILNADDNLDGTYLLTISEDAIIPTVVSKGDLMYIGGYICKILSATLDEVIITEPGIAAGSIAGSVSGYILKRDLLKAHRNDVVMGYTGSLKGITNTAIKGGSTGPNRGVNSTEVIRTRRTSNAFKAGYWNEFTGEFTTPPTVGDDSSALTITADKSYTSNRFTFTTGKTPTNSGR